MKKYLIVYYYLILVVNLLYEPSFLSLGGNRLNSFILRAYSR